MYVAVQGQEQSNKFKLSMWDALFSQDTYVTGVREEQSANVTVLDKTLTPYNYKYVCSMLSRAYFSFVPSSTRKLSLLRHLVISLQGTENFNFIQDTFSLDTSRITRISMYSVFYAMFVRLS